MRAPWLARPQDEHAARVPLLATLAASRLHPLQRTRITRTCSSEKKLTSSANGSLDVEEELLEIVEFAFGIDQRIVRVADFLVPRLRWIA